MNCSILINVHGMIGVDWHDTLLPPAIPAPVPSPHFVAQFLNGLGLGVTKSIKVKSHGFDVIKRGSDIGMGIGHVAANVLFPIHVIASGSKSEFASFSVKVENTPIAIACAVYVNFNLNCQGPSTAPVMPMPTGIVIAPGCNMAGFSLGDFFGSLFCMITDMLIQYAINKFGGPLGDKLNKKVFKYLGPYCCRYITPFFMRFPQGNYVMNELVAHTLTNLPAVIVGIFGLGSPVGYSPDYTPLGGDGYLGQGQDAAGEWISNRIDNPASAHYNDPSVEDIGASDIPSIGNVA